MLEDKFRVNGTAIASSPLEKSSYMVQGRSSSGSYSIQKSINLGEEQDMNDQLPSSQPFSTLIHNIKLSKRIVSRVNMRQLTVMIQESTSRFSKRCMF